MATTTPTSVTNAPHSMSATKGRLVAAGIGFPLFLSAIAFGALSVTGVLARTSEHHHASYAWHGGAISVQTTGSVTIRQVAVQRLDVTYTSHFSFRRPTVTATSDAGGVALRATCPGGFYGDHCAINYVVTVPAGAALDLRTGKGRSPSKGSAGASPLVPATGPFAPPTCAPTT